MVSVDKNQKNCHIIMREKYGWKLYNNKDIEIWFCGYIDGRTFADFMEELSLVLNNDFTSKHSILSWIKSISGHFAIVIKIKYWVIAAVDRLCTIPIFIANKGEDFFIGNHAPLLKKKCAINDDSVDFMSRLEIAMSGYTIGSKTLYSNIERLEAGECIFFHKDSLCREFYYTYYPCKTIDKTKKQLKKEFTDVCIDMLIDLRDSSNGRQIVIPLSAGNDSRLIASGLKELGVENVICFSYGRKGNFETPTSKEIAKKLGYRWLHIPVSIRGKRDFFKSEIYQKFVAEFESFGAIPNVQEIYEVSLLKQHPLINENAIIVNGNSGDFISGGHIVKLLNNKNLPNNIGEIDWGLFLEKHYSLWLDLRSQHNDDKIISELKKIVLLRLEEPIEFNACYYSIMESLECIGRQSKYVAAQQRTYEYFGFEWRLPFWSNRMFDFWEGVPLKYKLGQKLYLETLHENNWGDVWMNIDVNNKKINPYFLRWIRALCKMFFIPIGRKKWYRFERNALKYFIHPSYALTIVPYLKILFNRRGYRSKDSWLSHKMLKDKGLSDNLYIDKKN
jgi:asparagine synthase (glutamine-hydrolysing)